MSLPAQKTSLRPSAPIAPAGARPAGAGTAAKPGGVPAPTLLRLKKGQMLFSEGENSRSMYFLKTGMIRIFKKKGDSSIEIDTIRAGQILGELAFLDGNPRSASGEALSDCELTEISGQTFQAVLGMMPDWLKLLLKTVVGRLRTASTRIRQLEAASTALDYSDKDGKRSAHYVYLSPHDTLKICSAILLCASYYGIKGDQGILVKDVHLNRFGNHIFGMPEAKIATVLDMLHQVGVMIVNEADTSTSILKDADTLEKYIVYQNDENIVEANKRHDISIRGFIIMGYIVKHLAKYPKNAEGTSIVNLAEIRATEMAANGNKEPFRMDEFPELVKVGYATQADIKNTAEVMTQVKTDQFMLAYRMQKIVMSLHKVNEEKRKGGK